MRCISRKKQRGQIALLMTFTIVPMIGLLGMVSDLGYMNYIKQSAQAAADSAVLAALNQFHSTVAGSTYTCTQTGVVCGSSYQCPTNITTPSNAVQTACLYAKQNGFQATGNQNVLVDSNIGSSAPATAPGVNSASWWIEVRVSQRVNQLFSAITGNTTGLVSARATGAVTPAKDCIYALDPNGSGAYYQNGNTNVTANCGLYVNSSNALAMYNSGNSTLSATEYDIVGNYSWHGTLTPTPTVNSPATVDPLSGLAVPSPCSSSGGCNLADCSVHPNQVVVNNNTTLFPGTYCGGIYVKKGTATLSQGTYILVGGGMGTQDANSIITGTGIFIYNTYNSTHTYQGMAFAATSTINLTAATSGTYGGILYMADRNYSGSEPTESFQGGPTSTFEGTIYAPKSLIQFAGNPSMTLSNYTILVGYDVSLLGTSTLNDNYSVLTGGTPIQQVSLIE